MINKSKISKIHILGKNALETFKGIKILRKAEF